MKKSAPPAPMMGVELMPITTGLLAPFVGEQHPCPGLPQLLLNLSVRVPTPGSFM